MNTLLSAVLIAALLLLPVMGTAIASDENQPSTKIDDMVVTATRSKENIKTIPAKVEVIDAREIELTTGKTLTEQLKKNASIGVIEYGKDLAGIGIRGFRPEFSGITKHSLVLIDGRPAGATNLATVLSDNIERIEILKGPASSLYGAEAMGGVVNIITKKNTGKLTGMVELGAGFYDTNFQKAALGGGISDKMDFDISAGRYDQQNDFQMGNGDTRANTSFQTQNADIRFGMDFGETWRADIGADGYQGRAIETPGDIYNGDVQSGKKDMDRWGLDLNLEGRISKRNTLFITAYNTRELQKNYQNYTGYGPYAAAPTFQSYDSETNWIGLQIKDAVTWKDHKIILGMDFQDIDKESRSYNQDGSRKAPYYPDESRKNIAGYMETIWNFMDKHMTATLGGRYDTFDVATESTPYKTDFTPGTESFSCFSPRAGLTYLFDTGIRLHSTIGKAFVPPKAAQLAGNSQGWGGSTTVGNPDLDPESSITYDAGIGYERSESGLNMDLTYFHTDIEDKIITETTGLVTTYRNSLGAEIRGLEYLASFDLGAPLKWDRSLTVFVNGTRIFNAEEEQTDHSMKQTQNVANHTVNYGITYDDGRVEAKLNARSQGTMKDTDWNTAGSPEVTYPGFTVVDLSAGINFMAHHKLMVKIDNLLDHDYYEKKGFPKPGQSIFVSYRYTF
ncbi:MAG: TonB-dependent receptor [Proteobacteria bacterium]|nr:TonB-dependent receptor [Pseudomonadota bacterium]MBU1581202.1 TonB-dependent receptor [Pseudomonadota bacterium]MBU2453086.1 TonB-dependent receptor [Pseudomonadota bacterium]MBU2629046.1 TonB-dependent receptor [Pseudomonadota bacterium]